MENIICKADIRVKPKSKKVSIIRTIITVIFIVFIILCHIPAKVSGDVRISFSRKEFYLTRKYYNQHNCYSTKSGDNIFGFNVYCDRCYITETEDEKWWKSTSLAVYDYESDYDRAKMVFDYAKKVGNIEIDDHTSYNIIDYIYNKIYNKNRYNNIEYDGWLIDLVVLAYIVVMFIIPLIWRVCIKSIVKGSSLQLDKDGVNGNRKKLFSNKSLNLPIEKVDSIAIENSIINKLVGGETIAVRSASGVIKFICVYNASEFVDKTLTTIKEYKESAKSVSENIQHNSANGSNSVDDIMKLKQLLDAGAITQEEFDAKKKELLNL